MLQYVMKSQRVISPYSLSFLPLLSTSKAIHETLILPPLFHQAHKDLQSLFSTIPARPKAKRSQGEAIGVPQYVGGGESGAFSPQTQNADNSRVGIFVIEKSLSFTVH